MTRSFMRRQAFTICLFGGVVLIGNAAYAQTASPGATAIAKRPFLPLADVLTGAAKDEYLSAKLLYETNDVANAVVKFRKAYSLMPEPRLLKNIAVCEKDLKHYSKALALITEYRSKASDTITPDENEALTALEGALRKFTSVVTLVVSEPGATVLVDGEVVGTSLLKAPIRVDVGERRISVQRDGFKPFELKKTIDGGGSLTLVAKLERDWQRGRLVVEAGPKDLIAIDGKVMALGRYEGYVKAGGHSVRVSAPGMAVYQNEVVVQDGETRRVPITLNPLPAKADMTKWLWVAGGVALAGGAAIAGGLLFKQTEAPLVPGTSGMVELSFGGRR